MTQAKVPEFKVLLIGDAATGKTSFVRRHLSGAFERKYLVTIGAEVSPLLFHTTRGPIMLNVWDTAGQEKFGGLRDVYYIESHACIMFFDVTSRNTYKNVPNWYRDVDRVCSRIPKVLVGNKVDVKDRVVKGKNITYHRKKNMAYFDLSAKSNYNIDKPFLYILRALTGDNHLQLVEEPAHAPAEIVLTKESIQAIEAATMEGMNNPLPEEEDEEL